MNVQGFAFFWKSAQYVRLLASAGIQYGQCKGDHGGWQKALLARVARRMEVHFRAVLGSAGLLWQRVPGGEVLQHHRCNPQRQGDAREHDQRPEKKGLARENKGLVHRGGHDGRGVGAGHHGGGGNSFHVFLPRHKMGGDFAAHTLRTFRAGPHTCVRAAPPADLADNTHPLLGPTPCCNDESACAALPRGGVRETAQCLADFVRARKMLWTAQDWAALREAASAAGAGSDEDWKAHTIARFPARLQQTGLPDGADGVWVVLPWCRARDPKTLPRK